jgi:hypothetical protein
MEFETIVKRALEIRKKYDQLNESKRGVRWNEQQFMAGFVGDVGDLSKIIMAKHGLRDMDDIDAKLAHEFMKTMDGLDERISKEFQ